MKLIQINDTFYNFDCLVSAEIDGDRVHLKFANGDRKTILKDDWDFLLEGFDEPPVMKEPESQGVY